MNTQNKEQFINDSIALAEDMLGQMNNLGRIEAIRRALEDLPGYEQIEQGYDFKRVNHVGVAFFILHDIYNCISKLGHGWDEKFENYPALVLQMMLLDSDLDFGMFDLLTDMLSGSYGSVAQMILDGIGLDGLNGHLAGYTFFYESDPEAARIYATHLYRFMRFVAEADGDIDSTEARWLNSLMEFTGDEPDSKSGSDERACAPTLDEAMAKLDALVGLEPVKDQVRRLANYVHVQGMRKGKGLKTTPLTLHCVFTGNPGTGKTTVARILADIYRSLGVLQKGHLVETDRSGLVAEYVGQTAVKTNKIIDSALDGVLFIDEAYSLTSGGAEDFGAEAIATLLKRMEDERDRLVVILAGYSDEMRTFIQSNPGLTSRFSRYIEFEDYSAEELFRIFMRNADNFGYTLDRGGQCHLQLIFEEAVANKDKHFGNARYARILFERTLENQAQRLCSAADPTVSELSTLTSADLPA